MKFQILSVFWGSPYATWFIKGALKSLSFPKNQKAINENCSTWNIFCDEAQIETIREITKITFPRLNVNIMPTTNLRAFIDQHQAAMCWQIEECLKAKERLLFAPPDTIFADGTVSNFLVLGREPKTCVAIAHPRVLPDILTELSILDIQSPAQMVHRIWNEGHLHQAWADAEVGHPRQNSFIGGVRWEKLAPNLFSITHHLPTVYFADFTEEDLTYFKLAPGFGHYDHQWPSDILIRQCRQRLVGSSDAGFICEITHKEKNIPPVKDGPTDGFWRTLPHNIQNRQTQIIFRGEP